METIKKTSRKDQIVQFTRVFRRFGTHRNIGCHQSSVVSFDEKFDCPDWISSRCPDLVLRRLGDHSRVNTVESTQIWHGEGLPRSIAMSAAVAANRASFCARRALLFGVDVRHEAVARAVDQMTADAPGADLTRISFRSYRALRLDPAHHVGRAMACICADRPYQRFQGDAPERYPELVVDEADEDFPAKISGHCRVCGTRWRIYQIPYGGIYGDFEWERIEPLSPTPL